MAQPNLRTEVHSVDGLSSSAKQQGEQSQYLTRSNASQSRVVPVPESNSSGVPLVTPSASAALTQDFLPPIAWTPQSNAAAFSGSSLFLFLFLSPSVFSVCIGSQKMLKHDDLCLATLVYYLATYLANI